MTIRLEEKTIEEILEISNFVNYFLNSGMDEAEKFDLGLMSIDLGLKVKQFYKQRDELKDKKVKEGKIAELIIQQLNVELQPLLQKKYKVSFPTYSLEELKEILGTKEVGIKTDSIFWGLAKNCIRSNT
jgi:hypothetical protein